MLTNILICIAIVVIAYCAYRNHRGFKAMSQSYDNLVSAANAIIAQNQQLKTQVTQLQTQVSTLQAAQGTSDAQLDTVTTQLNTEINTTQVANNG